MGSFHRRRSAGMRLPWEDGPLAFILGSDTSWLSPASSLMEEAAAWPGPVPCEDKDHEEQLQPEQEKEAEEKIEHRPRARALYRNARKTAVPWEIQEEQRLTKALSRWRWIVESTDPKDCRVHAQLLDTQDPEGARELLDNVFSSKATGTMEKRAGSIISFLRWSATANVPLPAIPFREEVVYRYVEHLRESGAAPTRSSSFMEAIPFTTELLGIQWAQSTLSSSRVLGSTWRSMEAKQPTKQAPAFSVKATVLLEQVTTLAPSIEDRVIAGNICFTIHTRMRTHDAANISREPVLDLNAEGDGFLEGSLVGGATKAGRGKRRRHRLLLAVALASGVSDADWARAWLNARAACGLSAELDGALFLMPAAGGGFTQSKMGAADLTVWCRELLVRAGLDLEEAAIYTGHSGRATGLSWCAKAGVRREHRRLLGGHAKSGDLNVLEYSRDALEIPLKKLARVYRLIRTQVFRPDASRANRWLKPPKKPEEDEEQKQNEEEDVPSESSADGEEEGKEQVEGESSSEEEDSEEETEQLLDDRAQDDEEELGSVFAEVPREKAEDGRKIFIYRPTGTIHLGHLQNENKLACYRFLTAEHFRRESWGAARRPVCKTCLGNHRLKGDTWPPSAHGDAGAAPEDPEVSSGAA